jgi:hypothetical protein
LVCSKAGEIRDQEEVERKREKEKAYAEFTENTEFAEEETNKSEEKNVCDV